MPASPHEIAQRRPLTQGYGLSKASMLPKDYGRFELACVALMDKLTIGSAGALLWTKPTSDPIEPRYIDGTHGGNTSHSDDKGAHVIKQIEMLKRQPLVHDFYVA